MQLLCLVTGHNSNLAKLMVSGTEPSLTFRCADNFWDGTRLITSATLYNKPFDSAIHPG